MELGIHWNTPYRLDISSAARLGTNELAVKVTNNWVNQLLWQTKKPIEKLDTWQLLHTLEKMPNDGILYRLFGVKFGYQQRIINASIANIK